MAVLRRTGPTGRRTTAGPGPDERCGECLLFGAIQGLSDGLVLVDAGGKVLHVNRSAERLLGQAGTRLVGRPVRQTLMHTGLLSLWRTAMKSREPVSAEFRSLSGRSIRATVSDCLSSDGDRLGRALLMRDVTREKKIRVELSESTARRLVEMAGPGDPDVESVHLTRREIEILQQLSSGKTNAAIAKALNVSTNTVATHVKHLFRKIGVHNRSQAAAYAVAHSIREPSAR